MMVLIGAAVCVGGKVLDVLLDGVFGKAEPFEFIGTTEADRV